MIFFDTSQHCENILIPFMIFFTFFEVWKQMFITTRLLNNLKQLLISTAD